MWKDSVIQKLQSAHMFETADHLSRFKELTDCYCRDPFFTPGLVKCMYLSCWDEEHFGQILDILNQMKFGADMGLDDMRENGEYLAEECSEHSYDPYVIRLSCAFLEDLYFDVSLLPSDLEPQGLYIINQALKSAALIDSIPYYR